MLEKIVIACGWGHIILSVASISIPRALDWKGHLKNLQPLLRQMFWTYAAYILVINFFFGFISLTASQELLNKSLLAKSLTLFIGLYWFARIGVQFFFFDRSDAPKGFIYVLGEIALVALFILFTLVYFSAFAYNNSWI